jgi:hypothetical protein
MVDASMATDQRGINKIAAAILARTICPDRADWPAKTTRELLALRFTDVDLCRFHMLLAKHYGDALTASELDELERYMFVNCFVELLHEQARRLLDKSPERPSDDTNDEISEADDEISEAGR